MESGSGLLQLKQEAKMTIEITLEMLGLIVLLAMLLGMIGLCGLAKWLIQ
jgi:hypothetical protein